MRTSEVKTNVVFCFSNMYWAMPVFFKEEDGKFWVVKICTNPRIMIFYRADPPDGLVQVLNFKT